MAKIKKSKDASSNSKPIDKNSQSSTGTNDASFSHIVMKRPSNVEILEPQEKLELFIKNGHLMKDKFKKKSNFDKHNLDKVKTNLMSKSGRIKTKKRDHLKYLDNILKSELKIEDNKNGIEIEILKCDTNGLNNNNDSLSDQNGHNSSSGSKSKKKHSKTSKEAELKKKNRDKNKKLSWMAEQCLTYDKSRKKPIYQCDYCQKFFINKTSLRRHIYVHLKVVPYSCNYCYKRFYIKDNLTIHLKLQHARGLVIPDHYVCRICEEPFLLKDNFDLHMATHFKSENIVKCIFCSKKFSHQVLLNEHEKIHLITGKYQCTACDMSYEHRSNLALHIKSHLKIREYICQHCGKEFRRLNSMRRHVQICHSGQTIQCPVCKKNLKGHLTEHLRTHEKKRPHKCPDCGQRFTQSTQLNVHRRSHTGDRPYPCRICNRPFTHSNALMLHIRRHTGEKPFTCAMCPLSFSQLPHMKAHMRNIHGKMNPYKCEKCNQFFKLKVHLENHSKTCKTESKKARGKGVKVNDLGEEIKVESVMSLSRMRFLLALLLTMIASSEKLKYLGFNKRLIDDLLVESLEAMGRKPCMDKSLPPLNRLRKNIDILLKATVPKEQMDKFKHENKTTEELLELLTNEKKSN